jgi:hypothetical protein
MSLATCGQDPGFTDLAEHVQQCAQQVTEGCLGETVLNLIHHRARFRICDVCIPDAGELLATLYGEQIVEGTIIDVSESGERHQGFAVVQLVGVEKPIVVPIELIVSVSDRKQ